MKIAKINTAVGILAGIQIFRISDKKTRTSLIDDYRALRPLFKKANEEAEAIQSKFQEDWKDELDAIHALREKNLPVVGHDAYLDAETDANRAIADIFDAEVEVDIKSVPFDDFLANCAGVAPNITLEQFAFLEEVGIIAG